MQFLRDFLNNGPKRIEARDKWVGENVMPFVPPELRQWLTVGDAINPVSDIRRAGEKARVVANPDRTTPERIGALGDVLVDSASVLAPAAAAKYSGKAAQGVVDALAMASMPADDAAQRFMADQSGAVDLDVIRRAFPGVKIDISGNPERGYTLNRIVVPEGQRGAGVGSQVMDEITRQADASGARIALSPSGDFGGSPSRLREFYSRFGFVDNKGRNKDFEISETMYRQPQADPIAARGDEILSLVKTNPASVTDEMLDLGDPVMNARLNEYLWKNYDLPMDEASRMGRAGEMGFDGGWYHGTDINFDAVNADMGQGERAGTGFFSSNSPDVASTYTSPDGGRTIPIAARRGFGGPEVDAQGSNWNDLPWDAPTYHPSQGDGEIGDFYGRLMSDLAEEGDGLSTNAIARQARFDGDSNAIFRNMKDSGGGDAFNTKGRLPSNVRVDFYPNHIRSRFARFDPRLSHLRNLSAGVAGAVTIGGLLTGQEAQAQDTRIKDYLNQ